MKSKQISKNSLQSHFNSDFKTIETPQTAESIEENGHFSSHKELTFSSFICSADKFFISQECIPQQKVFLSKKQDYSSKKQIGLLKSFLQTPDEQQKQLNFQIILKSQVENEQQQFSLSQISIKIVNWDYISQLSFINEHKVIKNNLQNKNQDFIICHYQIKSQHFLKNQKVKSFYLQLKDTGFQRKLVSIYNNCISKQSFQKYDTQASTFVHYDCEKQQLMVVFPLRKYQQLEKLKEDLTNKSVLLNEVKSIKQLKGILFQLCQQNMGSRIIQKLIHLSPLQTVKLLNKELHDKFDFLMKDKYGNYVVQRIFFHLEESQRVEFLNNIQSNIIPIAKTKFGTHCLQFILKKCHKSVSCMKIFQKSVIKNIYELSTDEFGTHFIQELIDYQKFKTIQTYFSIAQNLILNSCNKFGILVIKRLMKKICIQTNKNVQKRVNFLTLVYNNFLCLATNQYGHFLIQELPKYYSQSELQWILWSIVSNFSFYANNIFSSSTIRFYLDIFPNTWINTIVNFAFSSLEMVLDLMVSKPGTFLLHKLLQITNNLTKMYMIKMINQLVESIGNQQKRKKWKKYIKTLSDFY